MSADGAILSWLVGALLLALTVGCWALEGAYGAYKNLLDLYCLVQPRTPLASLRVRARAMRDLYRIMTPVSAFATVVWLLVALHLL